MGAVVDADVAVAAAVDDGADTDVAVGAAVGAEVGAGPEIGGASSPQAADKSRRSARPQKTGTSPGLTLLFTELPHQEEAGVDSTIHKFSPR